MIRNQFRHKVDIERFTLIDVGGGSKDKSWSTFHEKVPCLIITNDGGEEFLAGKTTVITSHKILMGYLTNPVVKEKDRVKYVENGVTRYFQIVWIKSHRELNETMRLEVIEKDF